MMNKITVQEAVSLIRNIPPLHSEHLVPLQNAVGHILSRPLYARYPVPSVPVSAMDGFAVAARETADADEDAPLTLKNFNRVNTGNVVQSRFDAVIKVEDAVFDDCDAPNEITIRAPITPGVNVRPIGEDILEGKLILPAGAKIHPFDVGAIAGYGITRVYVKSISVGIIPTGTELIEPGTVPKPGQVVESNTVMAESYLRQFGVNVIRYPPVDDNRVLIHGALENALADNDIVLISAGSSMGSRDYTSGVISEMGKLIFHGVFMKPAKPSMLGLVGGKPVIGMPGFPLSAQTSLRIFVRELLESWGWTGPQQETVFAVTGDKFPSDAALDEFSFAAVGKVCGRYVALPQMRASSVQMNGIRSNGNLQIPRGTAFFGPGERVPVVLNVPAAEADKTILLGGLYSQGAENLAAACTAAGLFVRFGNLDAAAGVRELARRACHGVCVAGDTDLSPLAGLPTETIGLNDGTLLVVRSDMQSDSLCAALTTAARRM